MEFELTQIGTVRNEIREPTDPDSFRDHESRIVIEEAFTDGLYRIEDSDYITILFYLHESGAYTLRGPRRYGVERGTFACRSPNRPSPIGTTTVELLERTGRELRVSGLDAINGTPVIDIKPYAPSLDRPPLGEEDDRRERPRGAIDRYVRAGDREAILLEAGQIHGHFCPYLALGVMAGIHAQRELDVTSNGMEDVVAVLETNSCFADGVQVATGCTFGNNALIYRDYGKTAVTLVSREETDKGVRIHVRERDEPIRREYPEAYALFERVVADRNGTPQEQDRLNEEWADVAFEVIGRPITDLCDVETGVEVDLPEYAPVFEDRICTSCGERVMAPKAVEVNGDIRCRPCADTSYPQLDG
ncbi:MAG: tRNA (N6-threonylcarbamoyladenosine(37)-N6)-methyltransferase TrmO, partial [Halodesulfurarchaeum sp.]